MPWPTSQSRYLLRDSSSIDRSLRMGVTMAAINPFRSGRSMPSSFFLAIGRHIVQRIPDGPPDAIRAHRHVDVAYTQVGERIDHRVLDRRPSPDGSSLADALRPQWVPVSGSR